MTLTQGGKQVLNYTPKAPPPLLAKRPAPVGPNGVGRLGMVPGGGGGEWAFASSTVLVARTANAELRPDALLRNPAADAAEAAPRQPEAHPHHKNRQTSGLQD